MAYQLNPNTGSLFVNQKKEKPNQPDYNGTVNVDGKVYYLAGWKKAGKEGATYLSLAISEPKQKEEPKKKDPMADLENDLPF
jgi:uncharacterized protein (DUF736 family)